MATNHSSHQYHHQQRPLYPPEDDGFYTPSANDVTLFSGASDQAATTVAAPQHYYASSRADDLEERLFAGSTYASAATAADQHGGPTYAAADCHQMTIDDFLDSPKFAKEGVAPVQHQQPADGTVTVAHLCDYEQPQHQRNQPAQDPHGNEGTLHSTTRKPFVPMSPAALEAKLHWLQTKNELENLLAEAEEHQSDCSDAKRLLDELLGDCAAADAEEKRLQAFNAKAASEATASPRIVTQHSTAGGDPYGTWAAHDATTEIVPEVAEQPALSVPAPADQNATQSQLRSMSSVARSTSPKELGATQNPHESEGSATAPPALVAAGNADDGSPFDKLKVMAAMAQNHLGDKGDGVDNASFFSNKSDDQSPSQKKMNIFEQEEAAALALQERLMTEEAAGKGDGVPIMKKREGHIPSGVKLNKRERWSDGQKFGGGRLSMDRVEEGVQGAKKTLQDIMDSKESFLSTVANGGSSSSTLPIPPALAAAAAIGGVGAVPLAAAAALGGGTVGGVSPAANVVSMMQHVASTENSDLNPAAAAASRLAAAGVIPPVFGHSEEAVQSHHRRGSDSSQTQAFSSQQQGANNNAISMMDAFKNLAQQHTLSDQQSGSPVKRALSVVSSMSSRGSPRSRSPVEGMLSNVAHFAGAVAQALTPPENNLSVPVGGSGQKASSDRSSNASNQSRRRTSNASASGAPAPAFNLEEDDTIPDALKHQHTNAYGLQQPAQPKPLMLPDAEIVSTPAHSRPPTPPANINVADGALSRTQSATNYSAPSTPGRGRSFVSNTQHRRTHSRTSSMGSAASVVDALGAVAASAANLIRAVTPESQAEKENRLAAVDSDMVNAAMVKPASRNPSPPPEVAPPKPTNQSSSPLQENKVIQSSVAQMSPPTQPVLEEDEDARIELPMPPMSLSAAIQDGQLHSVLLRERRKPTYFRAWKRRHVCIVGHRLLMYRERAVDGDMPVEAVSLLDVRGHLTKEPVHRMEHVIVFEWAEESGKGEERGILIACDTNDEKMKWVRGIKAGQRVAQIMVAKIKAKRKADAALRRAEEAARALGLPASPTKPAAPAPQKQTRSQQFRTRLTALLSFNDPEKVKEIDSMVEVFSGKEAQCLDELLRQYGGPPPSWVARVTRYCKKHCPSESAKHLEALTEARKTNEEYILVMKPLIDRFEAPER